MRPPLLVRLACTAILSTVLTGCLGIERAYPEKRFYALHAARASAAEPHGDVVLQVRRLDVGPRSAGRGLVYRQTDTRYTADFYHEFFADPAELVTEQLTRWLTDAGVCGHVVKAGSEAEAGFVLEGSVAALHGDFRDAAAPHAALELQVFVTRMDRDGPQLVFHRDYAERTALEDATPAHLVEGWNEGLQRILERVEADLRGVVTPSADEPAPPTAARRYDRGQETTGGASPSAEHT